MKNNPVVTTPEPATAEVKPVVAKLSQPKTIHFVLIGISTLLLLVTCGVLLFFINAYISRNTKTDKLKDFVETVVDSKNNDITDSTNDQTSSNDPLSNNSTINTSIPTTTISTIPSNELNWSKEIAKLPKGIFYTSSPRENRSEIKYYFKSVDTNEPDRLIQENNKVLSSNFNFLEASKSGRFFIAAENAKNLPNTNIALIGNNGKQLINITDLLNINGSKTCPDIFPNYSYKFNKNENLLAVNVQWIRAGMDGPGSITNAEVENCGVANTLVLIDLDAQKSYRTKFNGSSVMMNFSDDGKFLFLEDIEQYKKAKVYRFQIDNNFANFTNDPSIFTLDGYFFTQLSFINGESGIINYGNDTNEQSHIGTFRIHDGIVEITKDISSSAFAEEQLSRLVGNKIISLNSYTYISYPDYTKQTYPSNPNTLYLQKEPLDDDTVILLSKTTRFTGNIDGVKVYSYKFSDNSLKELVFDTNNLINLR